jgi:hypothetical protein
LKILIFQAIVVLFVLDSCNSDKSDNVQKVTFGIYETLSGSEIPDSILNSLFLAGYEFETDKCLTVIGYFKNTDAADLDLVISKLTHWLPILPLQTMRKESLLVWLL